MNIESSPNYHHARDSGYETTSSSIEQSRCLAPSSPSNVSLSADGQLITVTYFTSSITSHADSSLSSSFSSSNTMSRTLTTFSQIPSTKTESSPTNHIRLAEQEIIEV